MAIDFRLYTIKVEKKSHFMRYTMFIREFIEVLVLIVRVFTFTPIVHFILTIY